MQGVITYNVLGVYPAPSFFSLNVQNDGTVQISLAKDLRTDSLQLSQYVLTVQAYDSVYPNLKVSKNIVINVARNQNGPVFEPSDLYMKVISDGFSVGSEVVRVNAKDRDQGVSIV